MDDTPPPFDPNQPFSTASDQPPPLDLSKPYTTADQTQPYQGDTTASVQTAPDSFGGWLGSLGAPKAGTNPSVWDTLLHTVGSAAHGAMEAPASVVQDITKLAPQLALPTSDANGFPIDYGQGPGVVSNDDLKKISNVIPQYETDYDTSRPGELDKEGHNTSTDIPSDIAQMMSLGLGTGEINTFRKAAAMGGLSGLLSPKKDDKITDSKLDFLGGKALQTGEGAALGTVAKGLGDVISPNVNDATQLLLDNDIRPTTGQLLRQSPNVVNQTLGHIESLSSGLPGIGPAIRQAQDRSVVDLNKAVGNRALEAADLPTIPDNIIDGHAITTDVHDKLDRAYDQVVPNMNFRRDRAFQDDRNILRRTARILGQNEREQYNGIEQELVSAKIAPNGTMSGDNLKMVLSELRRRATDFQSSKNANERMLGDHVDMLRQAVQSSMVRYSNPADVLRLGEVDAGWRTYAGVVRPGSTKTASGVYSPAQLQTNVRQADKTVGKRATSEGTADQQDLSKAANQVLTKLPDSETANRGANAHMLMTVGGLGLAGEGAHETGHNDAAATLAALAAGVAGGHAMYSQPAQAMLRGALTGRQSALWQIAKQLANRGGVGLAGNQTSGTSLSPDEQMQELLKSNTGAQ